MAYNLGDITTSVKTRAKDTSLSDTFIHEIINATQTEVLGHRRYSFMERNLEGATLSTNASEYELDEDIQTVDYLALTDTNGDSYELAYVPAASWDAVSDTAGSPREFTMYGRTLLFNCPADASYRIVMRYLAAPSVLTLTTDVPDVPETYRELLVRGALAGVEEYRDNFDFAALHTRKVEQLAEDMTSRYGLLRQNKSAKRKVWSFRNASE